MPRARLTWTLFHIGTAIGIQLVLLLVSITLLLLLVLGMSAVGGALPSPPTLLETTRCPQPCWHGLRPGESTRLDVQHFLERSPLVDRESLPFIADFASRCLNWETTTWPAYDAQACFRDQLMVSLDLASDGGLTAMDVLDVFGEPTYADLCPRTGAVMSYRHAIFATLYFYDGLVQVIVYRPDDSATGIWPDMRVHRIVYAANSLDQVGLAAWHGFGEAGYRQNCPSGGENGAS